MVEGMEIPRKTEIIPGSELHAAINTAKAEVKTEAADPQIQAAKETARLGLFKELWQDALKPYYKKRLEIDWKNLKAAGMGLLSVIPIVDKAAIAGRGIGGVVENVSRWEKIKNVAKKGIKPATKSILHKLDPYPDVPGLVQTIGLLELVGVEFAELVPVTYQLLSNKVQEVKATGEANKAVTRVILGRVQSKLEQHKTKKSAKWAKKVESARRAHG